MVTSSLYLSSKPFNHLRILFFFPPVVLRGEPHSWWIRPQVNILSRLHVVHTIEGMLLYHRYLYLVARCCCRDKATPRNTMCVLQ